MAHASGLARDGTRRHTAGKNLESIGGMAIIAVIDEKRGTLSSMHTFGNLLGCPPRFGAHFNALPILWFVRKIRNELLAKADFGGGGRALGEHEAKVFG